MFDSGILFKTLVEELNSEVDIALDIPDTSYAEWLKWLMSQTTHNGKNGNTYSFVPVGNILPLLLMALLYLIILFVNRNKTAQL